ncbi:MAG: hypothetical protein AAGG80_01830 [Pseudomonadota bacterium]
MKMRNLIIIPLLLILLANFVYAGDQNQQNINYVVYPLTLEQWVSTDQARVVVIVNATVNDKTLATIRQQILQNLKKIIPSSSWRITNFVRSQTPAGLEQLRVTAETRVGNDQLAGLRTKTAAISRAGQKYSISAIEFSPSLAQIEQVKTQLRKQAYQRVKTEIALLQQIFPQQKYFLHQVLFQGTAIAPLPRPMVMTQVAARQPQKLNVSDKVILHVKVVLATLMPEKQTKA